MAPPPRNKGEGPRRGLGRLFMSRQSTTRDSLTPPKSIREPAIAATRFRRTTGKTEGTFLTSLIFPETTHVLVAIVRSFSKLPGRRSVPFATRRFRRAPTDVLLFEILPFHASS